MNLNHECDRYDFTMTDSLVLIKFIHIKIKLPQTKKK